jgi:hypothetical protein
MIVPGDITAGATSSRGLLQSDAGEAGHPSAAACIANHLQEVVYGTNEAPDASSRMDTWVETHACKRCWYSAMQWHQQSAKLHPASSAACLHTHNVCLQLYMLISRSLAVVTLKGK